MPIIGQISVGDGATFTPAVDNTGVISWTNNKNLPNPASVDIPQAVMDRYLVAPIASPAFTGNPTAPTQAKTDNSTKLATTAYVKAVVADYLELTGGSITGDVDITGDLSVSGTITGDLTGNVTGDVIGTASGNLPLAGGTMSGTVVHSNSTAIKRDADNDNLVIEGASAYNKGAYLQLYGKDSTNSAASFALVAHDGTNNPTLIGSPNGTLKWVGKEVERVNADSSNYIRYESGLQICWGSVSITPAAGGSPYNYNGSAWVTFPAAFASNPNVSANVYENAGYWNALCNNVNTTSVQLSLGGYNTTAHNAYYIAIGRWK